MNITDSGRNTLPKLGYSVSKNTAIKIRLVKVMLNTGEIEVLATSLLDKTSYPDEDFKELYFMRWNTETQYGVLKDLMQLEVFSGYSVDAIEQDFYAIIITANLEPIRKGRSYPRKFKSNRIKGKFQTFSNHKRTI